MQLNHANGAVGRSCVSGSVRVRSAPSEFQRRAVPRTAVGRPLRLSQPLGILRRSGQRARIEEVLGMASTVVVDRRERAAEGESTELPLERLERSWLLLAQSVIPTVLP